MDEPPDGRPLVLLFIVDAGGGHRAAANALLAAAESEGPPFDLKAESLQGVLRPMDPLRRLTGIDLEQVYNAMVRRRMTWHLVPLLRVLQWSIARMRGPLTRRLAEHLHARNPAAVVSLAPNFNAVIRDAVRAALPGRPFFVLMTDLADFPPHFWMEPDVDGVFVATDAAAEQARGLGLRAERTSGMVLNPKFYAPADGTRARVRQELDVPPDERLVLLLFGGKGTPEMLPLARRLLEMDERWHVAAVCGDNPRLFERMGPLVETAGGRLHRFGFTQRVQELMDAADLLLTKPGPGSLAEAFQRRLPVVVTLDPRTIPQERFNARFVEEQGLGVVARSWEGMAEAARELCRGGARLDQLRQTLSRLPENRAVWEALSAIGHAVTGLSNAEATLAGPSEGP